MLVEGVDAFGDGFAEAQPACDLGTTLAAGLDQFLGECVAVPEYPPDRTDPFDEPQARAGVTDDEFQHPAKAAVDPLEVVLEAEVIGQVELADPGGIAAAAQILQQQRVVELPQRRIVQAQASPDVGADPAAAHAMPRRLPLGEVEREAERADQLGKLDRRERNRGTPGRSCDAGTETSSTTRPGPS